MHPRQSAIWTWASGKAPVATSCHHLCLADAIKVGDSCPESECGKVITSLTTPIHALAATSEEFILDPVTREIMFQPCVLSCAHLFDFSTILDASKNKKCCPLCNTEITHILLLQTFANQIHQHIEKENLHDQVSCNDTFLQVIIDTNTYRRKIIKNILIAQNQVEKFLFKLIAKARFFQEEKNFPMALEKMKDGFELSPHNLQIIGEYVSHLNLVGEYQKALDVAEKTRADGVVSAIIDAEACLAKVMLGKNTNEDLKQITEIYVPLLFLYAYENLIPGANECIKQIRNSAHPLYHFFSACRYMQQHKFDDAEDEYRDAFGREPSFLAARIYYAECLLKKGMLEKAREEIDALHELNSTNLHVLFVRSHIYLYCNELQQALLQVNALISLSSNNPSLKNESLLLRAMIHSASANYDEALADYKLAESNACDEDALIEIQRLQAQIYAIKYDYLTALELFKKLLRLRPDNEELLYAFVEVSLNIFKSDFVVILNDIFTSRQQDLRVNSRFNQLYCWFLLEQQDANALTVYNSISEPGSVESSLLHARILYLTNQLPLLKDYLLPFIDSKEVQHPNVYSLYACAIVDANLEFAAQCFERALSIEPLNLLALKNYPLLLMRSRKYKEAIIYFSKVLSYDCSLADLQFQRGICYYKLGQFDLALDDFAYLRFSGLDGTKLAALKGKCLQANGDFVEALKQYETLQTNGRYRLQYYKLAAEVHIKQENYQKAEELLNILAERLASTEKEYADKFTEPLERMRGQIEFARQVKNHGFLGKNVEPPVDDLEKEASRPTKSSRIVQGE